MSLLLQNLAVLLAVTACAVFIARSAYRALQGRKSKLNGCGTCGGCATSSRTEPAVNKRRQIPFLPVEMLIKRR